MKAKMPFTRPSFSATPMPRVILVSDFIVPSLFVESTVMVVVGNAVGLVDGIEVGRAVGTTVGIVVG